VTDKHTLAPPELAERALANHARAALAKFRAFIEGDR